MSIYDKEQLPQSSIEALAAMNQTEDVSALMAPATPATQAEKHEATVEWESFLSDIEKFNEMYKLPSSSVPNLKHARLQDFKSILEEEVGEGNDISLKILQGAEEAEVLTDIADWLGDIVVYCVSEMRRYGLKPSTVLGIIMESNFSKLGEDGNPIYDERGKVQKGPGYWKPEPRIRAYIEDKIGGA